MFSGQPLIILGSTGPVYVFEKILYTICKDHGWDYLCLRMWVGLWVAAILLLIVAVDGSAYVCYITRYVVNIKCNLHSEGFSKHINAGRNAFQVY